MLEPTERLPAAQLLAVLPQPLLCVGPDDRIAYANDAAELMLGAGRDALLGRSLAGIVGPTSPILQLVSNVRRNAAPVSQHAVGWPLPNARASREVDVDGSPDGRGGVVLLVAERSLAGRIDRQLTHRGAARSVSGLATMLAHEIKNPLSGIRGAAQLLEKGANEEDKELCSLIRTEADRIVKLVNSMEVFSDERPLERAAINVHSVLDRVVRLARTGFGGNSRIIEEYDPSLPEMNANFDQLVQVFLNLMKNAVEASVDQGDPTITIRTSYRAGIRMAVPQGGGQTSLPLEVTVSDRGRGVPPELRDHLFDPFVTGRAAGTGLGLALVAKIVRDHGGIVDFETTGAGTTFRVLMPAWRAP